MAILIFSSLQIQIFLAIFSFSRKRLFIIYNEFQSFTCEFRNSKFDSLDFGSPWKTVLRLLRTKFQISVGTWFVTKKYLPERTTDELMKFQYWFEVFERWINNITSLCHVWNFQINIEISYVRTLSVVGRKVSTPIAST